MIVIFNGKPALRLIDDLDEAHEVISQLPQVGIDLAAVTQQLEDEGVDKFNQAFDQLMVKPNGKTKS
jgi:transaldolase